MNEAQKPSRGDRIPKNWGEDRLSAKLEQDMLYQQAIDMGGHPNERAITGNMDIVEADGRKEFRQIYLHRDGIQLDLRGQRFTVEHLLDYLASGMTEAELLAEFPFLAPDDIKAALTFAQRQVRDPMNTNALSDAERST